MTGDVRETVWCLHCERVGPAALVGAGGYGCFYCGAGEWDLWDWFGPYEPGRVYEQYSDEQLEGVDPGGGVSASHDCPSPRGSVDHQARQDNGE